jgi:hypothetical protein
MSDYDNPYQSPETPIVPEKLPNAGILFSETILRYLKEASPWMRFVGIMGIIGSGFVILAGLIAVIVALAGSELFDGFPTWLVSLFYLPAGILLFFPSFFTYNIGVKIRSFLINNLEEDLELAFKNNKSLWKFNGILYIIYLSFIPIFILIIIITGIVSIIPGL